MTQELIVLRQYILEACICWQQIIGMQRPLMHGSHINEVHICVTVTRKL